MSKAVAIRIDDESKQQAEQMLGEIGLNMATYITSSNCIFCNYKNDAYGSVLFENDFCVCMEQPEPILVGSCIVIPRAHRITVFDLTREEWAATKQLIDKAKQYLDAKYRPDGYNIGWNCGEVGGQTVFHAHLHIVPRHADEPFAGRGIRNLIKRDENRRPSKKS